VAGVCLLLAATACIVALWPATWHTPGYTFGALLAMPGKTELELTEVIAAGYENGINANDRRVERFGSLLRLAWVFFLAAPLLGAAATLGAAAAWVTVSG